MTTARPLSAAALHALMECNAGRVRRAAGSATWYSRDDGQSEALNAATMRALFARGLVRAERRTSLLGGSVAIVTVTGHHVIDAHLDRQHGPAYPEVSAAGRTDL